MLKYTSQNQLEIFDFKTEFESKLDPNNRWVKMAKLLDWDKFAVIYGRKFSGTMGAKGIDARVVIGALIIKHLERKDDRGTIQMISENPYMQFFLGFDRFSSEPIFDPSLFVLIRKRLGDSDFDEMNKMIISKALNHKEVDDSKPKEDVPKKEDFDGDSSESVGFRVENQGKLQLDATIADSHIKFPTDLGLLNDARMKSELIIDALYKSYSGLKPRTYRIEARKKWLNLSKKKRKSSKELRKGIGQQLGFVERNIRSIDRMLDFNPFSLQELSRINYKYLLVIRELVRQQRQMYNTKSHSIDHRIVSIHQPHVRPMVRGKQGRNVEFGAKLNVSLQKGYARIDQVSFDAFNEGVYLREQVERYRELNGFYPELVQSDDIYMNRENRQYLKANNIRHTGRPLGRKPKVEIPKAQKRLARIEKNERNHIEGKFGQAKSKYNLNKIMAKLDNTSKSWIACIFLVMNILKLSKDCLCLFLSLIGQFVEQLVPRNSNYLHFATFQSTRPYYNHYHNSRPQIQHLGSALNYGIF